MKVLTPILLSIALLLGASCEGETKTVQAKTVQLLRIVCDPVDRPASLDRHSKKSRTIIIEGVYKVSKELEFFHVNGNVYTVPKNFRCKAKPLRGKFACVQSEGFKLLYEGPCKFKDQED